MALRDAPFPSFGSVVVVPFGKFPGSSITIALVMGTSPTTAISKIVGMVVTFLSTFPSTVFLSVFPFATLFPILSFTVGVLFLVILFSLIFGSVT